MVEMTPATVGMPAGEECDRVGPPPVCHGVACTWIGIASLRFNDPRPCRSAATDAFDFVGLAMSTTAKLNCADVRT